MAISTPPAVLIGHCPSADQCARIQRWLKKRAAKFAREAHAQQRIVRDLPRKLANVLGSKKVIITKTDKGILAELQ